MCLRETHNNCHNRKGGITGYIKEGNAQEQDRRIISERSEPLSLAVKEPLLFSEAEPFDVASEQKMHILFVQTGIVSPTFFVSKRARKSKSKRNEL